MPITQTTTMNKTWKGSKSLKCVTSALIQKASASQKRKNQNTSSFRKTKRRKNSTVDAAGAFRGLVVFTVIFFLDRARQPQLHCATSRLRDAKSATIPQLIRLALSLKDFL